MNERRWDSRGGTLRSRGHTIIRILYPLQASATARQRFTWLGIRSSTKSQLSEVPRVRTILDLQTPTLNYNLQTITLHEIRL